jgi:hypothetical protein
MKQNRLRSAEKVSSYIVNVAHRIAMEDGGARSEAIRVVVSIIALIVGLHVARVHRYLGIGLIMIFTYVGLPIIVQMRLPSEYNDAVWGSVSAADRPADPPSIMAEPDADQGDAPDSSE